MGQTHIYRTVHTYRNRSTLPISIFDRVIKVGETFSVPAEKLKTDQSLRSLVNTFLMKAFIEEVRGE